MKYKSPKTELTIIQRYLGNCLPLAPQSNWALMKQCYPDHIVLLDYKDVYFTFGIDALILHAVAGIPLHDNPYPFCCFFATHLDAIITLVIQNNTNFVLCHDPADPASHLFI